MRVMLTSKRSRRTPMDSNPYAPPTESVAAAAAIPPSTGVSLSEQGWRTVTSLSKWMRIVATFYFLLGGLLAVGAVIAVVAGNVGSADRGFFAGFGAIPAAWFGSLGVVLAVVFILGAVWLRRAAFHFYDGVLSNAEQSLGLGFRKLRLYLILYGAAGLLSLAHDLYLLFFGAGS